VSTTATGNIENIGGAFSMHGAIGETEYEIFRWLHASLETQVLNIGDGRN